VVLMIADSVEAASRTLNDYTKESISNLVDSILRKKISESQFENSDITYKEVNIVRESLKRQLAEIYHARISYK
jgi:cyclic-di-AMP phosphodiesterase PgpH